MALESRISQFEQESREHLQQGQQWATDMVQEQPAMALGSVFALGFLVGASIVTFALTPAPTPQRRGWQAAQDFGNRMVDQLGQVVPKQVSSYFHR